MPRMFGKYGPLPTAAESYDEGKSTGVGWRHAHEPGGPFVHGHFPGSDPAWNAFCRASQENHDRWLEGFKEARRK